MDNKYQNILLKEPKIKKINKIFIALTALIIIISIFSIHWPAPQSDATLNTAKKVILGILTPSMDKLFSLKVDGVLYLILETMAIAFLGTILGAIFAIIPAFLGASNFNNKYQVAIIRTFLNIIRSVPVIIYGLLFIKVTSPGPFAGVMTFSLTSIGMIAKLYIEALEELDTDVLESMDSVGASYLQKIRFGIFPQIKANFLSTAIYRYEINVKDAAVLGLVSAGGLGSELILAQAESRWSDMGAYIFGLIILVFIIEHFSTKIRSKLVNG